MTFPIPRVANGDGTLATQYDALADAVEYLQGVVEGDLQTWTPAWTGATTSPTNFTSVGSYRVLGPSVWVQITLTAIAGFTGGTGQYNVSLPIVAAGSHLTVRGRIRDATDGTRYLVHTETANGQLIMYADPSTAGGSLRAMTGTVPITLANGDIIQLSGWYTV